MTSSALISINFPAYVQVAAPPASATGFSVDAQGTGSFTGLSYTVPAHAVGTVKAKIQTMAITSAGVKELDDLVMSMLSASEQSKVTSYKKVHASANLSIWTMFSGGASASYDTTNSNMKSMGLTTDQISTIIDKMLEIASQMSNVLLDFTIDNSANDYSVSGNLQLYTLAGTIQTASGSSQYRMLADQGSAGGGAAPASGKILPLS